MSRRVLLTATTLLALALSPALAASAKAPNLNLELWQRSFAGGESIPLQVELYNLKQVQLAVYPVALEALAPNAAAVMGDDVRQTGSLPYRLRKLRLQGSKPILRWTAQLKTFYRDSWDSLESKVPGQLSPGVYVVSATGGGLEKRTWFAVSGRALLLKRSPDVVLAWLVNARTGQPVSGVPVALYDARGKRATAATTGEGLVKFPAPALETPAWISTQQGDPAFALASSPDTLDPYVAYLSTDRPVYRPGHTVRFRGTLRERQGQAYGLPPRKLETVRTQIKTDGGMTVYQQDLSLNQWGTFSGEFQLGPEPPLGDYEIVTTVGQGQEAYTFLGRFRVEAYRKPEFTVSVSVPKTHYVGGEEVIPLTFSAKYFFGSPVSGGKLSYTLRFHSQGRGVPKHILKAAGLGTSGVGQIEAEMKGQTRLGADGVYTLNLRTLRLPTDRTMTVEAEVSETALRPQTGRASITLTAAALRLSVAADKWRYQAGEKCRLKVTTTDYDGQPVSAAVKLAFIENLTDREGRRYEDRTRQTVETNSQGEAFWEVEARRLGSHEFEAWALDAGGNAVFDQASIEVVKKIVARWPALELRADKATYQAGETAQVTVETDQLGAWMLVTVEGAKLYSSRVYRVQANRFKLPVPLSAEQEPNVEVHAALVRGADLLGANVSLALPPEHRRLQVILTPKQERYQPAQEASYLLTTRDRQGRGVPAEVGLGVVDASVYEIRADQTPEPFQFFWGDRDIRVETDFSLANMYPGGAYQRLGAMAPSPPPGAPGIPPAKAKADGEPEAPRVRKFFTDTAYWGPSVVTGPDGSGEIKYTLPDNLTTWRATARGLTQTTQAGEARRDVVVTLPLLVRFSLPRFYVQGDEATAAATVHNYTGEKRTVKVTLTAEGAQVLEAAAQTVTLEDEGLQRLTWKIKATGPDQARFLVSADGGPGGRDATEATLPVQPDGLRELRGVAGMTATTDTASLTLPAAALPGSGLVEVTLSPSLAGPIFEALEYLTTYPYGCAEQTMESFLPDVVVANTLQKLGAQRPRPALLDRYVSFGLQKLMRYQHRDGGWHWWEFDDSDPYISAYVCTGLKIAEQAGYVAARGPLTRGVGYLREALEEEEYRDARAYLLWALATCDLWAKPAELAPALKAAQDLYEQRAKLSRHNQASLALACRALSRARGVDAAVAKTLEQHAQALAGELEQAAKPLGLACFWGSDGAFRYSWLDSNVEVTSQVLTALLTLKPSSARIQPAVRWLMAQRQGKHWTSTKDTAAAVLALTQYLAQSQELQPEFTARVRCGDKLVREVAFTRENLFADPVAVVIPAADLKAGENVLRLEKTGAGNLYWQARLSYLTASDQVRPATGLITLERRYHLPAADPVSAGEQQPGHVVQVEVTVRVDENLRYALLQEPIPAGCEVLDDGADRIADIGCDRKEVRDNRLTLYFDYLPRGEVSFRYALRCEAPGRYRILPTQAELMYFPEVRGNTQPVRVKIGEAAEE